MRGGKLSFSSGLILDGHTNTLVGLSNKTWDADNFVSGRAATEDQLKEALASLGDGGTTLSVNGGSAENPEGKAPKNLLITVDGGHYDIALNKAITLGDGVNAIHLDGETGALNLGDLELNAEKGTVGHLKNTTWNPDAYTSGQAATEDQLYQATQAQNDRYKELRQDIHELNEDIRDTGAAAASLAALKPIQYDPRQPSQFMAGAGAYRGSYAFALGLAHYSSERVMWNIGAAVNRHPMVNVGVTFKFGNRKLNLEADSLQERYKAGPISASYVMQHELANTLEERNVLRDEVALLKEKNSALETRVSDLSKELGRIEQILKKLDLR